MTEGFDYRTGDGDGGEDVYSRVVRAGKRTYFFDVKATRNGDYYLTVTESRKKTGRDGTPVFEKSKIFLYKEDFAKFEDGLDDAMGYVREHKPEFFEAEERAAEASLSAAEASLEAAEAELEAEFAML
jgi:hypothetical protein